ncbi:MAG: TIGR03960 family B12-binding radical SAM protein [Lachnospiraceae bacterium]|nr:TIGR03960 family B12-binding radical SAM protein [Lachnospiraceae bacterium]
MDKSKRKLALPHRILMEAEKPARYTGGELNSVMKEADLVKIRFCFCFPDVYEIGMSHLGMQILYGLMNSYEDVWCERVFSPWTDMDAIMRREKIPLFALESQEPVKNFDFLGFTLQYEMCYVNILQVLQLSGMALYSRDRGEDDPIVIGGGPCTYNAEPIADFFDIFYIGEGEVNYRKLFDLYEEHKEKGYRKADFLHDAAKIEGIYVPALYDISYNDDNTVKSITPGYDDIPATVRKTVVKDLDGSFYPTAPVVPFIQATQDRAVLEVMRGCIRGCRFCQAGQIYKPVRARKVDTLMRYAEELLNNTGYEELSLSSLSTSDFPGLKELLERLINMCNEKKINISLPSLRIDAFSLDVMNKVQDVKKNSLTFAPEAGSQRMRNVINKGLTVENILNGAEMAFKGGWNKVKLYFMIGLPGEEDEDVAAIAELSNEVAALYYDTVPKSERQGRVTITASSSFFVPKPFTAFQWAAMNTPEEFLRKAAHCKTKVREQLNQKSIVYHYHDASTTIIEGVLARGDRRLAPVIEEVYRNGGIFDAWTETFSYQRWMDAFESCGVDYGFYIYRERPEDEVFPWDVIDSGVTKKYLYREWMNSKAGTVTLNCRDKCVGCGAGSFTCGICIQPRGGAA